MSFWPFVRSPFTDLTGCLVNHQGSRCGPMEMKVMDCLEAYGVDKGYVKCEALIKDFQECAGMEKQLKRFYAMRSERIRQYSAGERTKEERFAKAPEVDSY